MAQFKSEVDRPTIIRLSVWALLNVYAAAVEEECRKLLPGGGAHD